MDTSEFERLSELAEEFLNWYANPLYFPDGSSFEPTGQFLYLAVCHVDRMDLVFDDHSKGMYLAAGSPKPFDGKFACSGRTAHQIAACVIRNVAGDQNSVDETGRHNFWDELGSKFPDGHWPHWDNLPEELRDLIGELERTGNGDREGFSDLVDAVWSERVKYLQSLASQTAVSVTDSAKRVASVNRIAFAETTANVPEYYKENGRLCGPLVGNKTALAKAVTANPKAKPDVLHRHHGKKVFVRKISDRSFEVFFRTFKDFQAAKALMEAASEPVTPVNSQ